MRIRYTLNYLSRGLGGTRAHVSTDLLRNGRKQGVIVTISKPTNNLVPYFWVFQIKKTIFRIGRKQGDNHPNDGNNPRNPVDVCAILSFWEVQLNLIIVAYASDAPATRQSGGSPVRHGLTS